MRDGRRRVGGFTLVELVLVIVIIAALASMVVVLIDNSRENAELTVAQANLRVVSDAVFGSAAGVGYLQDMKHVPGFPSESLRMRDLFSLPPAYPNASEFILVANRGWRGPYLRRFLGVANTNASRNGLFPASGERRFVGDGTFLERGFYVDAAFSPYGLVGDFTVADPWGNPVVIQAPLEEPPAKRFRYVRLVSAGPDGVLSTPLDKLEGDITAADRGDDLILFAN